jgi:hypothetical protein
MGDKNAKNVLFIEQQQHPFAVNYLTSAAPDRKNGIKWDQLSGQDSFIS